jgi:hypothetical protein
MLTGRVVAFAPLIRGEEESSEKCRLIFAQKVALFGTHSIV